MGGQKGGMVNESGNYPEICKKSTILCFKNYKFKCVIGKKGIKKNKIEGDKATPKGTYSLGKLYFRADRIKSIKTKLLLKIIKKNIKSTDIATYGRYNRKIASISRSNLYKSFDEGIIEKK